MKLNGGRTIKERAQDASSRSLSEISKITVNLGLEFLNKCDFHCAGCFVNRKNTYSDVDLDNVLELTEQYSILSEYELNELVLGPTDFFATENVEELFTESKFLKLFDYFQALTITSTMSSNPEDTLRLWEDTIGKLPKTIEIEMFVSLDVEKFVGGDIVYIATLERNLQILKDANIIFIFNMYKHPLFEKYADVAKMVNDKYNSHLKMNPSFFRGRQSRIIQRELSNWKQTIEQVVEQNSLSGVLLNVADDYFGGYTYLSLSYKSGKLYLNPCVYDYVLDETPMFVVPKLTPSSVELTVDGLTEMQYDYSIETNECTECNLLSSCIAKKVLSSMEQHDIKHCLMPKTIIQKMTNKEQSNENIRAFISPRPS